MQIIEVAKWQTVTNRYSQLNDVFFEKIGGMGKEPNRVSRLLRGSPN